MTINIIIRVDDISDRFDFYDLKKWFIANFPQIPVCFYVQYSHYKYKWDKKVWNEIKKMIKNYNWEIGGHSRTHPHLPMLTNSQLKQEIENNIRDVEKNLKLVGLNYKITSFAYPYGEFDERVKKILCENGIIHGLTYIIVENYDSQLFFPKDNLYEIGIGCNATGTIEDWKLKFDNIYKNGDSYILCLHTSLWTKKQNGRNLKRIFRSKSIKELYFSLKRFFKFIFKKGSKEMWNLLGQHLEYINNFSNIHFITLKDLL